MNEYKVDRPIHFNLSDILDSGQAFMYSEYEDGFLIITKGKRAFVKELPSEIKFFLESPTRRASKYLKTISTFPTTTKRTSKNFMNLDFLKMCSLFQMA